MYLGDSFKNYFLGEIGLTYEICLINRCEPVNHKCIQADIISGIIL